MKPFHIHEKKVTKTLEKDNGADNSIDNAIKHVENYGDLLEKKAVRDGHEPSAGEMLVLLEAEALAVGDAGLAYVSIDGTLQKHSSVTIAVGGADALAAASGDDSFVLVHADADAFGADYVYRTTIYGIGDDAESVSVRLFAVDYHYLDYLDARTERISIHEAETELRLEGHVAQVEVHLNARGDATLVLSDMRALAVEDTLAAAAADGILVVA